MKGLMAISVIVEIRLIWLWERWSTRRILAQSFGFSLL